MPDSIAFLLHEVPAHFARSTLRREEFLEIQQALGCTGAVHLLIGSWKLDGWQGEELLKLSMLTGILSVHTSSRLKIKFLRSRDSKLPSYVKYFWIVLSTVFSCSSSRLSSNLRRLTNYSR